MDFSQVRYFLALADTLNFTRAAEQCHVTQPTLTQAIKRLEEELGGQLVLRDGRNTRLSALGKGLRAHFEQIVETKAALKETARSLTSGAVTELNIGLMCTIGPRVLSRFLEAFRAAHPNTELFLHDVTPDRIADSILSGALDGCFCANHGARHPKLDYTPLFTERMVVAFANDHQFGTQNSVTLKTIADQRYLDRLHCEFRDEFNAHCARLGVKLDTVFTSQREDWIQNLIRDGAGVAVVPEYSLIPPVLAHRPIIEPELERDVEFAVAYGGPKTPGLRRLADMTRRFDWPGLVADLSKP